MAHLIPFRGVLYNPALIPDISRVVAPPYDVVDDTLQRVLHDRHPHNVIRLELGLQHPDDGPSQNRYTRAAAFLHEWLANGVVQRDSRPAIYPYRIEYSDPSSEPGEPGKVLKGFLATVELEEFGTGKIYPHENTRAAAKTDRFKLLEACRANFSPIFSLFSDPDGRLIQLLEKSVNADKPRLDFRDDAGFRQQLWAVTDWTVLDELIAAMKPTPLFIADGHHRYETALAYRRARREQSAGAGTSLQPYDSVLMLFASLEDPGLTVLPTHRVLTTPVPPLAAITGMLHEAFEIEEMPVQPATEAETRRRFLHALRTRGQSGPVFGLARRGAPGYFLLTLRPSHCPKSSTSARDKLDVSLLQALVLNQLCPAPSDQDALVYTKDEHEALDLIREGRAEAALLLNPTKVGEVRAVAAAGERMPHKSTYFFPKPLTGLVINIMEE